MKHIGKLLTTVLTLIALSEGLLYGQLITGSMVGAVTDQSGAVVPEVSITVTNVGTGVESSAKTDNSGTYSALNLQPGNYRVTAEKPGFGIFRITGIQVAAQQTVRQDVQLNVGALQQTVEVAGAAPLLQTDSATIGSSTNLKQIANLPQEMQSIDGLQALTPGAQVRAVEQPQTSGARYGGGSYFTLNGTSEYDAANGRGATSILGLEDEPPISSLQEFKVESVNANAEYRVSNTIILVTKAGTNQFHGQAYEYVQNTAFNANDFLLNAAGEPRPALHWNQFGANLGGPIWRNKAFFFFNYSGFRRRTSSVNQSVFPTTAMRQGDFSALCPTYGPDGVCTSSQGTQLYNPFTGQPFANNSIPTSLITSQAQTLVKYLPTPTDSTSAGLPNGSPNYTASVPQAYDRNSIDFRLDYHLSNSDSLYGVYSSSTSPVANSYQGYPAVYGNGANFADLTHNYSATETHVFSSRTINEFRLGYFDMDSLRYGQNGNFDPRSLFPQLPTSTNHGLPTMNMQGYRSIHDYGSLAVNANSVTWGLTDSLTQVLGQHTIKAGVDISHYRSYGLSGVGPLGAFSFSGVWTGGQGFPGTPTSPGNAFADFLLGTASSSTTGTVSVNPPKGDWDTQFYVQDTWQAAPKLTVYFGVRYMYQQPWTVRGNLRSTFDPQNNKLVLPQNSATPTLPVGGSPALFAAYQFETTQAIGLPLQYVNGDKNNWGPRLGFAYRLSGSSTNSTVVRGGYGVFYDLLPCNVTGCFETNNPPFGGSSLTYTSKLPGAPSTPFLPDITFANPFPTDNNSTTPSANPSIKVVDRNLRNTLVQQWNLTLEHQFGANLMARTSYVASATSDIWWYNSDHNLPAVQVPNTSTQAQRTYQPWSSIDYTTSGGKQNLQELQLELIMRPSHGFSIQAEYQFVHSLDDVFVNDTSSTIGQQQWRYPQLDYGNSDHIQRQVLVVNYIYELPFGKNRTWLANMPRAGEAIVGGWQVSGITTYGGGQPLSVDFDVPSSTVGWLGGRADRVPSQPLYARRSGSHDVVNGVQWFNPAAFTSPAPWTWGNSGRNLLFGPGYVDWDMSLLKSFAMPKLEGHRLEVRADFFNAFNHFNLDVPDTTVGSPQFGGSPITTTGKIYDGAGSSRVIQLGARYQF